MATLPVVLVDGDGDGSAYQPRAWWQQLWSTIDETVAAPNDADYISGPLPAASASTSFTLAATPADLGNMDTLTITVRVWTVNRVDDWLILAAKVVDSATGAVLAGGTYTNSTQIVKVYAAGGGPDPVADAGPITFATLDASATKAQWDSAILVLYSAYAAIGSPESFALVRISALQLDGTYTAGGGGPTIVSSSASGSGTGTGTSDSITVVSESGAGAGAGTGTSAGALVLEGSAAGSGSGTGAADSITITTSDATGTGTSGGEASAIRIAADSATGSGVGSGTSAGTTVGPVVSAGATGSGSGSGVADGTLVIDGAASGTGSGTSAAAGVVIVPVLATGTGTGAGTSAAMLVVTATATGSGIGIGVTGVSAISGGRARLTIRPPTLGIRR